MDTRQRNFTCPWQRELTKSHGAKNKLVEKLFPTIALAYKQKHPTHLEIPMVVPQFLRKSYSLFYLFMTKLANERVSAVERGGEATSEQHVNK